MKEKLNKESRSTVELMISDGIISRDVAEKYFPEIKESEDEKIRDMIIESFDYTNPWDFLKNRGVDKQSVIAWLEKQGEKDTEILNLKDQIESLHAAIKAIKETHRIELESKVSRSIYIPQEFEKYIEHLLSLSDGEGHGSPAKVKEVSAELFKLAQLEQKPAEWNEDDYYYSNIILYCLNGETVGATDKENAITWLESLKDRAAPQPKQE